jgi:Cu(I)/Ag(I) efflux system membrane fusion protein
MASAADELPGLRENSEALVVSARRRLKLFGVSKADISRLERTGKVKNSLEIMSPYSGTVIRVRAVDGLAVTPATELYAVADLSRVWIMADVYEPDFPWIRQGDGISVTSAAMPGERFAGTVEFVYPYENQGKRTIQVRMSAENGKLLLKPGMFVNVVIDTSPRTALAIPSEAVLRTGARSLVFVQREPGKFEPRDVITGIEASGYTEITKGLEPHEKVVLSGQFLIDSESKLREATLKMISGQDESGMKDMEAVKQQSGAAGSTETAAKDDASSAMDMKKGPGAGDSR